MILSKYCKLFLLLSVVCSGVLYAESLYGFGAQEVETPSRISVPKPMNTMAAMRQRIIEQDERIDGLTTIIEGLSASLNEFQSAQKETKQVMSEQNSDELLQKLADMIDEINANYVRKDELQTLIGKKSEKKSAPKVQKDTQSSTTLDAKSNATLYSEGVRNFVKKRYDEAKKRFILTDKKGYKPAASNYYLGEIAYYTKQYEDAIFYFKKSAGLYDKAGYIDVLLLHTAISLHKTGQKDQAKIFYENIIANYPDKKTAKIAKDRLKKL